MSVSAMLAEARKWLGTSGRPNTLTRAYASRNGEEFASAPWCDISVTEWARRSGNAEAVLPKGDRAFTIWHAQDGRDLGLGYAGTAANIKKYAKPGAIAFMAWEGTDRIGDIDHVGIVEKNLGDGRVQLIEGNTGDACKRRVRGPSVVAWFWNPRYAAVPAPPKPAPNWTEDAVKKLPILKQGDKGWHVKTMHYLLLARDYAGLDGVDDTVFTEAHANGIRGIQQAAGIEVDAICGINTWKALLRL